MNATRRSQNLSKSLAPAGPSIHEALHERVLGRLAGDDIAPFDMVLLGRPPAIHRDCDSGDVVGNRMSQP